MAPEGDPGADAILEGLRREGIAVRDRFLAASEVAALADCAQRRRARGEFSPARIGGERRLEPQTRGDSICWLADPEFEAEHRLLRSLEALRLGLNGGALLGLFDLELHYAWYPAGAGYGRHIDQPQHRGHRQVSLVMYLNEDWRPADGGTLRYFLDSGTYRDIEPVGGRLVAFLTEGREHAVLATSRPRLSLTGWYRSRETASLR